MAIMHLAIFDAVNAIEPRYHPYLARDAAPPSASEDAAASAAAAAALTARHPPAAADIKAALESSLAAIPDGDAKSNGARLGAAVAAKILEARANDGSNAPKSYRPRTSPGVYVPTAAMVGWAFRKMTPFAIPEASYFPAAAAAGLAAKQRVGCRLQ